MDETVVGWVEEIFRVDYTVRELLPGMKLLTFVWLALVNDVGDEVVDVFRIGQPRVRGEDISEINVFDGEIDDCRVLLGEERVPGEPLHVQDEVSGLVLGERHLSVSSRLPSQKSGLA